MEFRVLEYFLAIAREGSFSKAAKQLHITQPTLSRQISDLEKEIGKVLFIRGKKQVSLTEDGVFLFNRAKEIVSLKDKTLIEFSKNDDNVYGNVYIGGGESLGMSLIAKTIKLTQDKYPNIRFHLFSGNAESVVEKLERGLIDFGILINSCVTDKYEHIKLGVCDQLGVLMRKDDVLANKNTISISDITNKPLIVSAQESLENIAKNNYEFNELTKKAICTYNLLYNASLLVREKVGYCICIDNIINTKAMAKYSIRSSEEANEKQLIQDIKNIVEDFNKKYEGLAMAEFIAQTKMKAFEKSDDDTIPKVCTKACEKTGIKGEVSSFHAGAETHIYAHEKNKHGQVFKPCLLGLADIYNMHSSDEMVNIESFLKGYEFLKESFLTFNE